MPVYEITAPDGNVYEVTAPEGASEQDVLSYAQSNYTNTEQTETKPKTGFLQDVGATATGALDMASFGFSDEAMAGAMAALDPKKTYKDYLPEVRAAQGRIKEGSPYAYGSGQFLGAVAPAVAAAPLRVAKAIGQYAAKGMPQAIGTGAATGLVSGGIYGLGSGTEGQRAKAGAEGMAFGAAGGVAGGALGGLAQRALKAFKKAPAGIAQEVAGDVDLPISGKPKIEGAADVVGTGATKLLRGAQTQDIKLMRAEELARQGLLGSDLEKAIQGADEEFIQSVRNTVQNLAGDNLEETSQDTLMKAVNLTKNKFKAQKALQGQLMDNRNNAIAKAKVWNKYTKETLGGSLNSLKETPDFKVNLQRAENTPLLQDFKILDKILVGNKKTGTIDMASLGAWRSGLNSYPKGTQQSVLASKMAKQYDAWLDDHLQTAMMQGDSDLVDTILNANKKYAEFKSKYGTNKYDGQKKILEDIFTKKEMTPRKAVNALFGKSLSGNDYTEQYVKRLIDGAGDNSSQVKEHLKAGLYQKAFEDSFDDATEIVKLGKLKNNLIKLKNNDAFKKYLSDPEQINTINQVVMDINKFQKATSDRRITAPSAPMMGRIFQSMGALPVVRNLSLARGSAEALASVAKAGANAKDARIAEKSLAEFYKIVSKELDETVKLRYIGQQAGGMQAAASAQPNETTITVNPRKE